MINTNNTNILSPVRTILAMVSLNKSDTVVNTFSYNDALQSVTIERAGDDTKFFGYGVAQKLNVKLRDTERAITDISTDKDIVVSFKTNGSYVSAYPRFYVTEARRDENTNALSVTAYDALYSASKYSVADLALSAPYTVADFAAACAEKLGLSLELINIADDDLGLNTSYENGANFTGNEDLRTALDAVAEAIQAIYYVTADSLVFKRLDASGAALMAINRDNYISLDTSENRRLSTIYHSTELGDDVFNSIDQTGSTQYVRNNPFWDMRDDVADLVDNALNIMGGFTIGQFTMSWRGSFTLEIGDKLKLITKDGDTIYSYLLNDSITYNGAFSEKTEWKYKQDDRDTSSNASNLGDILNDTRARVDKVNNEIEIVTTKTESDTERISALEMNLNSISASVTQTQNNLENSIDNISAQITTLQTEIEQTAETVKIDIKKEIQESGIDKVITATGFTFDADGLTINKDTSEISTQITENGMTVSNESNVVLTANSNGVKAVDLHAQTYLIIGNNSRLEDYNYSRTGCFWIGG